MEDAEPLVAPAQSSGWRRARAGSDGSARSAASGLAAAGFVPPPRRQSWLHASAVLAAELVGTGVLALPRAVTVVGPARGAALLVVFSALCWYSGILLHRVQSWFPAAITYGDAAGAVLGARGRAICAGFIYLAFFGNLALYLLTCAAALQEVLWDRKGLCTWPLTAATVLFLLPLNQLRSLHMVSYAASASAAAILAALAIVLVVALTDTRAQALGGGEAPVLALALAAPPEEDPRSFFKVMNAITVIIFCYGGHGLFFEVMSEMKEADDFPRAISLTTVLTLAVYLVVSLVSNAVYGDELLHRGNILFALPDGGAKRVAAALLFFHVCVSYVLAQQVIGRAIHVRFWHRDVDQGSRRERWQWFGISLGLALVSFFIANGIPFFSSLMGLIGACSTAPLTFAFPALMAVKGRALLQDRLVRFDTHALEYPVLALFLLLAAYLTVVGVASNLKEISNQWARMGHPFACHSIK
jgi:amino acid permease